MLKHQTSSNMERKAWYKNSRKLAKWSRQVLCNRQDMFGRYVQNLQSSYSATTCKEQLTIDVLIAHFKSKSRGNLIGLHTTNQDGNCRWIALDIDQHGPSDLKKHAENESKVCSLYQILKKQNLSPILMDSNGKGGYHFIVIFQKSIKNQHAYRIARWVLNQARLLKFNPLPEIFPKQPSLKANQIGNWLRLPGLHPREDHFTRVWNGTVWLKAESAIHYLIQNRGIDIDAVQNSIKEYEYEKENSDNSLPINVRKEKYLKIIQSKSDLARCSETYKKKLAKILSRLNQVSECSNGWQASCPAHADTKPSLSVSAKPEIEYTLIHCFAGCEPSQILNELGLKITDLFGNKKRGGNSMKCLKRTTNLQTTPADSKWKDIQIELKNNLNSKLLEKLADELGVSAESLKNIGLGFDIKQSCWTFPEHNGEGQVCGIMRRMEGGQKSLYKGGRRGLILPKDLDWNRDEIFVAEGASDVAALLSNGFTALGRSSANTNENDLVLYLNKLGTNSTVIILADNDSNDQGLEGAKKLAGLVQPYFEQEVKVATFPKGKKDAREFFN